MITDLATKTWAVNCEYVVIGENVKLATPFIVKKGETKSQTWTTIGTVNVTLNSAGTSLTITRNSTAGYVIAAPFA